MWKTRWIYSNPWRAAVFMFSIDFGMIMLIRRVFEGQWYLRRWWSFRLGDSIFLPIYAYFTSRLFNDAPKSLFENPCWHRSLLFGGVFFAFMNEMRAVQGGMLTLTQVLKPSQAYHTLIFGPMFYLVLAPLPTVVRSRWSRDKLLALAGFVGYVVTYVVDTFFNDQTTPESF